LCNNVSYIIHLHLDNLNAFFPPSVPSSVWPYIPLLVPALIYSYQYEVSWQIQLIIEWWFLRRSFLKHFPNTAYVNNSLDHQDWNPINIVDPRGLHSHILFVPQYLYYIFFINRMFQYFNIMSRCTWYNIMW
jgi:hypothetical protein